MADLNLQTIVGDALRRAYSLGQTYWQQADSEYVSQHKKADATAAKFGKLVDEIVAQVAARSAVPAQASAAAVSVPKGWKIEEGRNRFYITSPQGMQQSFMDDGVLASLFRSMLAPAPAASHPPALGSPCAALSARTLSDERFYTHKACDGKGCAGCEWAGQAAAVAGAQRINENSEHIGWILSDGTARYFNDPTDADVLRAAGCERPATNATRLPNEPTPEMCAELGRLAGIAVDAAHWLLSCALAVGPQPEDAIASDHTVDHRELAGKILSFAGISSRGSFEPGADPLADRLAEKLAGWGVTFAPGGGEPSGRVAATVECPDCKGSGLRRNKVSGTGTRQCQECGGSGEVAAAHPQGQDGGEQSNG